MTAGNFAQTWANADADAVGKHEDTVPPEPGSYFGVTLIGASAWVKEATDQAWMRLRWKLNDGTDHEWDVLYGFKNHAQANVAKNTARTLGIDIDKVAGIEALDVALDLECGKYFDVNVVQNGEYRNTYVEGPAKASSVPVGDLPSEVGPSLDEAIASGAVATESADDSIPFRWREYPLSSAHTRSK